MEIFTLKITHKLDDFVSGSLLSFIDKNKKERLVKFVFWQDMQRSLLADLLVRKIIIEAFQLNNREISFVVNEYGKPFCDFLNKFHFNISHSGDWVVCAIDENPVGIDIEKVSPIDLEISKNFFSDKEHEDLSLSNHPFEYFFTLWSLKESYIKFIGKGLSHPLNSFSMKLISNDTIYMESHNQMLEHIYFKQYLIDKGYKMAVCGVNPMMPDDVFIYTMKDVVNTFIPLNIPV